MLLLGKQKPTAVVNTVGFGKLGQVIIGMAATGSTTQKAMDLTERDPPTDDPLQYRRDLSPSLLSDCFHPY